MAYTQVFTVLAFSSHCARQMQNNYFKILEIQAYFSVSCIVKVQKIYSFYNRVVARIVGKVVRRLVH